MSSKAQLSLVVQLVQQIVKEEQNEKDFIVNDRTLDRNGFQFANSFGAVSENPENTETEPAKTPTNPGDAADAERYATGSATAGKSKPNESHRGGRQRNDH